MRQAFRVARRGQAVLVASDGLSDPFDEGDGPADVNGFGLEVFAVSADPIDQIPGSWLLDMVWQMSQFAAQRGDIPQLVSELGFITTELYDVSIPDTLRSTFVNDEGRVGVILGIPDEFLPASIDGPLSTILLLGLKLLTLDELVYCVEYGDPGRKQLARRFEQAAPAVASSLFRASVV